MDDDRFDAIVVGQGRPVSLRHGRWLPKGSPLSSWNADSFLVPRMFPVGIFYRQPTEQFAPGSRNRLPLNVLSSSSATSR